MLPDRCNYYLNRVSRTPLVPVQLSASLPLIWCKLEFLNPSGSTKDRIAQHILTKAWREGRVRPGGTVIEASSGSTSIAMALASAQLGLRFIAVMPEGVSNERVYMIRAFGGEIRLTKKEDGILGAIAETERLAREYDGFLPRQFSNPENAQAHRLATAREILDQIPGESVEAVAAGVGTGGTLVGLYQGFRDHGCNTIPVHARPVNHDGSTPEVECCSFSARIPGVIDCVSTIFRPHELEGLRMIEVEDDRALDATRQLLNLGFPVGPSSGLNLCAAMDVARECAGNVVTIFPDRMERYFTTELFRPFR